MAIKCRKNRRPNPVKGKSNPLPTSPQIPLFDARCHVHISATPCPLQDVEDSSIMILEEMRFKVDISSRIEPMRQARLGLGVLAAIRQVPQNQRISSDAARRFNVEGVNCNVTCRAIDMFNSGIVQIRGSDDGLQMSLPHPKKWAAGALGWVRDRPICCDHERVNPTPWIPAKTCNCPPTKAGL